MLFPRVGAGPGDQERAFHQRNPVVTLMHEEGSLPRYLG
jgi:hypothetical protein